jgi:hypothetical protein
MSKNDSKNMEPHNIFLRYQHHHQDLTLHQNRPYRITLDFDVRWIHWKHINYSEEINSLKEEDNINLSNNTSILKKHELETGHRINGDK